ncbi:MAG TPA: PIN domain-containing protein [Longimicrobium sp.]|nr:PIN domain-containing protein [Longimicrobium sp.]
MRPTEVFVDTACVVALVNSKDELHQPATALFEDARSQARLVTTRAVCFEIGNFFKKTEHRRLAAELLQKIENAPDIDVLPVTDDLYQRALRLFGSRPDKQWSLTDCSSFVVMRERGITDALTADHHFSQAGFLALLRRA